MYRTAAAPEALLVCYFASKAFGLDRDTGEMRWKTYVEAFAPAEKVAVAVAGDAVILCSTTKLVVLDHATGELRRVVDRVDAAASAAQLHVLVDGTRVFVSGDGAVACYASNGELLWQQPFRDDGNGVVSMALPGAGDRVVVRER